MIKQLVLGVLIMTMLVNTWGSTATEEKAGVQEVWAMTTQEAQVPTGLTSGLYDEDYNLIVSEKELVETYKVTKNWYMSNLAGEDSVLLSDVLRDKGWSGIYVIEEGTTQIGTNMFVYCDMLTEVVLPKSLESIGDGAFAYCTGLTEITLPEKLTTICPRAFFGCSGLDEVNFSEGLESIGDSAFDGCTGLKRVTLPNTVTGIGAYAFYGVAEVYIGEKNVAVPVTKQEQELRENGRWTVEEVFEFYEMTLRP